MGISCFTYLLNVGYFNLLIFTSELVTLELVKFLVSNRFQKHASLVCHIMIYNLCRSESKGWAKKT